MRKPNALERMGFGDTPVSIRDVDKYLFRFRLKYTGFGLILFELLKFVFEIGALCLKSFDLCILLLVQNRKVIAFRKSRAALKLQQPNFFAKDSSRTVLSDELFDV